MTNQVMLLLYQLIMMEITEEEEDQISWKQICQELLSGKEYKEISATKDSCILQYPCQVAEDAGKNIYAKISYKSFTFSLVVNLVVDINTQNRLLKLVTIFNRQSQLPNFKYFYNPDNKTLTCKGIFAVSQQKSTLSQHLQLMKKSFEACLRQIYELPEIGLQNKQPRNRGFKEKQRSYLKFLGQGKQRIDNLRSFIHNQIQSRRTHYTVKPLEKVFCCTLFQSRMSNVKLESPKLSKEEVQKIDKVVRLIFQKRKNPYANEELSVLKMITIEDSEVDRTWDCSATNNSNLEKIMAKCQIFKYSINSQANKLMAKLENERQKHQRTMRRLEQEGQLKIVSRQESWEIIQGYKNKASYRSLIVKKPTQEGKVSYQAEISVLKYLREVYSSSIASYYVEEIEDPAQTPEKLYVDYYQRALFSQGFSEKDQFLLAEHLAEGIGVLYNYSILHRDLKPSNVMICSKGNPKIIDFGSAHSFNRNFVMTNKFINPLRTTIKYNLFYHQLPKPLKDSIEKSSYEQNKYFDIYSFGVLLFDMMKLDDLSNRGGKTEYIWENLRWVVRHTAVPNPHQRVDPLHLAIFMNELYNFYLHDI